MTIEDEYYKAGGEGPDLDEEPIDSKSVSQPKRSLEWLLPCPFCGELNKSLAAIHYFAANPSEDKIGLLATMATIANECERHLPSLNHLRT